MVWIMIQRSSYDHDAQLPCNPLFRSTHSYQMGHLFPADLLGMRTTSRESESLWLTLESVSWWEEPVALLGMKDNYTL